MGPAIFRRLGTPPSTTDVRISALGQPLLVQMGWRKESGWKRWKRQCEQLGGGCEAQG